MSKASVASVCILNAISNDLDAGFELLFLVQLLGVQRVELAGQVELAALLLAAA